LQSRKHGGGVSSEQQSMIEVLSASIAKQQFTSSTDGGASSSFLVGYGSEDSDGSLDGNKAAAKTSSKNDGRKAGKNDDDDSDGGDSLPFGDEDAYDTFDGGQLLSPSGSSKKPYVPMRKSTISFMNYVESRRQSKLELNGPLYGSNSKTKGAISGEIMSTLSNTMSSVNNDMTEEGMCASLVFFLLILVA
jgi:hypothetical protein